MRSIGMVIVIAFIMFGFSIFYDDIVNPPEFNESPTEQTDSSPSENPNEDLKLPESGIQQFLQMNQEELLTKIGEPDRIDPTPYGYQWWIYDEDPDKYIQLGVDKGRVVTLFALGRDVDVSPLEIGQQRSEIEKKVKMNTKAKLEFDGNEYQFELTEEEMNTRPLVKLNGAWAQLYMDKFEKTLVGIRYLTPEILIMQRPYSLEYRGRLIEQPELAEKDWEEIQNAEELQIFTMTNVIRKQYDVPALHWHEETSQVAYGHSKEMNEENYFSHESPNTGSLSDRLNHQDIDYSQAGENIAANYIDGIEAVIGWLNSEGHRKAMLNEEFTHLGVGVYERYYTQNFIVPR
ncbi:CAP domain-containing protein [Pseudalkalibacillus salsuginis]|uniref:CAP domain-containing protein n=1 Tax=Pseudalkalibacillus salsuginis TaxID=2910972 RepID=UPI001F46B86E|nr:CAP domain-containing protein [Pseudalkalibacillus salsuginis]MCF6410436.1 CAP domain-containing protein [Pseudalkalibacillus salsuginis]